jgi:hypothetical protein
VQVVTILYGEYTKLMFDNKDASVLIRKGKLYILVVIDIQKTFRQAVFDMRVPPDKMELWEREGLLD